MGIATAVVLQKQTEREKHATGSGRLGSMSLDDIV